MGRGALETARLQMMDWIAGCVVSKQMLCRLGRIILGDHETRKVGYGIK